MSVLTQADLVKIKLYKNVTFLPIWHSLRNNWGDQLTPLGTYLNREVPMLINQRE